MVLQRVLLLLLLLQYSLYNAGQNQSKTTISSMSSKEKLFELLDRSKYIFVSGNSYLLKMTITS